MFRRTDPNVLRRLPAPQDDEQANGTSFVTKHCDCLPCRHGLPRQHVRRTDQLAVAR